MKRIDLLKDIMKDIHADFEDNKIDYEEYIILRDWIEEKISEQ